jgi:predicted nucleic acid-binding protein
MPDRAVLDSSVIASLFFKEEASERALEAIAECDSVTLDLAAAEVGNVAWKQVVLFGENREVALRALHNCLSFISETCDLARSLDLALEAYEIAVQSKIPFYDSLYMAAAKREGLPLLTLDRKLYEKAKTTIDARIL